MPISAGTQNNAKYVKRTFLIAGKLELVRLAISIQPEYASTYMRYENPEILHKSIDTISKGTSGCGGSMGGSFWIGMEPAHYTGGIALYKA